MRLLLVRNAESEALKYVDLARADQKIVLMQNAVHDAALEDTVHGRGIKPIINHASLPQC